jgi:peptidoglycan/xylan/chitin deacetylase (PgdA/CDA1 family)
MSTVIVLNLKRVLIACVMALALFAGHSVAEPAKILLTFDDGPNPDTTSLVLDELEKRDARAVFFVLTGPETLFRNMPWKMVFPKGETDAGLQTMVQEAGQGHLLACHWGGTYIAQSRFHPKRMSVPAYDATGDGVVDRVSQPGNALESDLLQCQQRVNQALKLAQLEYPESSKQRAGNIGYIRPPIWKYKSRKADARQVYSALGMKMILTDFKLGDGGQSLQGIPMSKLMARRTANAIMNGQSEVILTLHDSNARTARKLSKTLDDLEKALQKKGLVRGVDWRYTRDITDINQALTGFLARAGQGKP